MCKVISLYRDIEQHYSLPPEEAVLAAYAQHCNDWSTRDYKSRYGHLVKETNRGFLCGEFWAPKEVHVT